MAQPWRCGMVTASMLVVVLDFFSRSLRATPSYSLLFLPAVDATRTFDATSTNNAMGTPNPPPPPPPPSNNHFQYLNLKGFSLPHGFGMGGSTEAFRFFIPEALDDTCVGRSACLTFEQGELCPQQSRNFEVDILEVCGSFVSSGRCRWHQLLLGCV